MPALVIVTNLYQYIIALYGLHKVSVIDFGKKSVANQSYREKDLFCLKPLNSKIVTLLAL